MRISVLSSDVCSSDLDAVLAISEEYIDDCTIRYGDLLPYVGTAVVARDMDAVRAALGDEQLSFLGFSYGSMIGQVYADLFPENIRSMILDGIVELGPTGLEAAEIGRASCRERVCQYV